VVFWLQEKTNLSIRSPEATSISRATAFNKHTGKEYFENLANVLDKHQFTQDRIYNVDETGVTTVQSAEKIVLQLMLN